ncbi:beta-N-acetylglucosaminidase domain-containing protein [Neobacillus kokaensis]|uniref:O-GlcNAcase n=1 Tax=Neobacillus kokaensis TaxID=2759023 RepID=A0ABQ3MZ00_9BACI|nr:beta-N-acetylglucosaminidase domain-containing protein [Neobacillus kokaensis]GHH97904.1 O-GlcNAcase [Neobacillus kokaensis]
MKKKRIVLITKRLLMFCLGFILFLPSLFVSKDSTAHATAPLNDTINIFPTPQQWEVNGTGFPLNQVVGLMVGDKTDPYAIKEVIKTLRAHGVNQIVQRHEAEKAPDTPVTIVIGGPSENSASVDALKALGVKGPEGLKKEGYVLATGHADGHKTIVLAGKDAAGTFYAAMSFQQIIQKRSGQDWIPSIEIRDWPQMELRGSVEGFYGVQWTHEERLDQLDFYGQKKINQYVYAPKDDPYHRHQWREPYPKEDIKRLKELLDRANQNHVEFVFAVSPGASICHSGDSDFQALIDKMQTVYDIGVRSFALFYDDISKDLHCTQDKEKFADDPSPFAAAQAYLLNRFNKEFIKTHEGTARLITVPTDYTGTGTNTYKERFGDLVDSDVIFYWTGTDVASPTITGEQTEKISDIFKHDILIWDNYTAHDYNINDLITSPLTGRSADLSDYVIGFHANPMSGQPEASKLTLFTAADYMWNPDAYHPENSWLNSIKDFGGEHYKTLKTFLENTYSSRFIQEESLTLTPLIRQFWEEYEKGNAEKAASDLLAEFANVIQAPKELRSSFNNKKFLVQTEPWLHKLELYGQAGQIAVNMLMAQAENNGNKAWQQRVALEKAFEETEAIPQVVAREVMTPFLKKALEMNDKWLGIIKTRSMASLGIYRNYNMENMIDNNPNTWYWSNRGVKAGDYVGIDLGSVFTVNNVQLLMGAKATSKDYIRQGILEYSTDGKNWSTIVKGDNELEIQVSDLNIKARYIRYRATADQTQWVQVREFQVISDKGSIQASGTPSAADHSKLDYAVDSDVTTAYAAGSIPKQGESLIFTLSRPEKVSNIVILQDTASAGSGKIEVQNEDGNWITVGSLADGYTIVKVDKTTNQFRILWDESLTTPIIHEVIPQFEH